MWKQDNVSFIWKWIINEKRLRSKLSLNLKVKSHDKILYFECQNEGTPLGNKSMKWAKSTLESDWFLLGAVGGSKSLALGPFY